MEEKELVEYIAKNLVNDPSQVEVQSRQVGNTVTLQLHVSQSDMGRVIGKQGRVANAIRSLLRVVATENKTRINLEID